MSSQDFFFALEFSSQGVSAELLAELAAQVLNHVGSARDAVPDLADALKIAVAKGTAAGQHRCDVQFRGDARKLDFLVSSNGGRVWQTTVVVPEL